MLIKGPSIISSIGQKCQSTVKDPFWHLNPWIVLNLKRLLLYLIVMSPLSSNNRLYVKHLSITI